MRRALRALLPGLSAVYGLTWDDVVRMPRAELVEYRDQLAQWTQVVSAGAVEVKD